MCDRSIPGVRKMSHNAEKVFYEQLARLLLETFLPDCYRGLTVSDRPDLRMGKKRGIEVTRVFYPGAAKAAGIFRRIKMRPVDGKVREYMDAMEALGYKAVEIGGVIGAYHPVDDVRTNDAALRNAFMKKVRAAVNYRVPVLDLFIYSTFQNCFDEDVILGFMQWVSRSGISTFSRVIVFEYPCIYAYLVKNRDYVKVRVDDEKYRRCCSAARAIASGE